MSLGTFNDKVDAQDLRREWEEWHRAFDLVLQLRNIESQQQKLVTMLAMGGRGLQRIFYNLRPVEDEVVPEPVQVPLKPLEVPEYDNAVKRLEKFFVGKRNERVELELFRSLRQSSEESFNSFILRLRIQASRCEFSEREGTELLQQITMGAHDEKVRDKGLENVMSLDEIINYAMNREVLLKQREKLKPFRAEPELNSVSFGHRNLSPKRNTGANQRFGRPTMNQRAAPSDGRHRSECSRCGSFQHTDGSNECFARGAICNNCGQRGHYARKCKNRRTQRGYRSSRREPRREMGREPRRDMGREPRRELGREQRRRDEANSVEAPQSWKEEMPHRPSVEDIAKVE